MDKCKHFTKLLKKGTIFHWGEEQQDALEEIKKYLLTPPVLTPPWENEPFSLYSLTTESALGIMLAQKNEYNKEQAIYYLSWTLVDYELKYVYMEKLCLAIVFAAKKLRHYMLNHTTYVIAKVNPLRYMMNKTYQNTRIAKWIMYLTKFDL